MTNSDFHRSAASEQDYLEDNIATVAHHLAQPGAFLCVHYDGDAKLLVDPGEVLKEVSRRLTTAPAQAPPLRKAAENALRWFKSQDLIPEVDGKRYSRNQAHIGPVTKKIFDDLRDALAAQPPAVPVEDTPKWLLMQSDPAAPVETDSHQIQYVVEGIILRRLHEKRIEGYTIETAKEIAQAVVARPQCSAGNADEIASVVGRLRNFAIWNARHSHYDAVPLCKEAADLIERLTAVPQTSGVPADQVARTIALSYGRDPDALTEWTEMCDAHNRPVPIWKVYEEQAEALLASYSITRPHGRTGEP